MKKRTVLGVAASLVVSAGLLTGCGNTAATEPEKEELTVTDDTTDTEAEAAEADENAAIEDEEAAWEESFGLQDYEGLYCATMTEEIEDYEVTYTYGYLFNGDGTGVHYGQDEIDFTWNETEIHFADSTESYVMEPGKLTVRDIVYDKIEGNYIMPNPCDVDTDDLADGIYHVYIDKSGIDESDGQLTVRAEIYTEDSYDIVDIHCMTEGDAIYIKGQLLPVRSVEQTDSGIIDINGGVENGGSALIAVDESNCFVYAGMDLERSYTLHGITTLAVSDSVKLIDKYDLSEEKEYAGAEAVSALKDIVEEYPLTCYDGTVTVENGEIVEIQRVYRP